MSHPSHADSGAFTCIHCKTQIPTLAWGTKHRNHCPRCLWSRHVDETPGDRQCTCRGPMEPIAIETRDNGEWAILHRCTSCKELKANRVAGDDDEVALLTLILRPLSNPAFPLDALRPWRR
ncbi:MAG: RNHCP domain-containing protein [Planctomycetota bacterium]|nr:RNHCP domain-containing protein [Planctomycetota bacterium]